MHSPVSSSVCCISGVGQGVVTVAIPGQGLLVMAILATAAVVEVDDGVGGGGEAGEAEDGGEESCAESGGFHDSGWGVGCGLCVDFWWWSGCC
jgi:hypothetical protein